MEIVQGQLKRGSFQCPNSSCKAVLDGWTGTDGEKPKPGDFSICFDCCSVLTFGIGLMHYELVNESDIPPEVKFKIEQYKRVIERIK